MAHGMKRSVIMSHGNDHDAKGVKGAYMKGTIPPAKVADAIPGDQHAVGELAEPGDRSATPARPAVNYDPVCGRPVVAPSTPRPEVEEEDDRSGVQKRMDQDLDEFIEEAKQKEAEAEAAEESSEEAPAPVTEEPADEPTRESVQPPGTPVVRELPDSRRKLSRAKQAALLSWCEQLEIVPEDHLGRGESVTPALMRRLIGEKLGL